MFGKLRRSKSKSIEIIKQSKPIEIEQSKDKIETKNTFLEISKNAITLKQFSEKDKKKVDIADKIEHERIFFIPQQLCFNNKILKWLCKRGNRGMSFRVYPYLNGNLFTHNISDINIDSATQDKVNTTLKRFIEIKANDWKTGLMRGTNIMPTKEILITTIAFSFIICFIVFGAIIVPNLQYLFP